MSRPTESSRRFTIPPCNGVLPRRAGVVAVVATLLCIGLLGPSSAFAIFVRTPLRELPSTLGGKVVATGIAVDETDHLWVENNSESLAEFAPVYEGENKFLETLSSVTGHDLAIEFSGNDFLLLAKPPGNEGAIEVEDRSGTKVREWGQFSSGDAVAVDNAPNGLLEDPSACGSAPLSLSECFVYVTEQGENGGISKFNPRGEAEPFTFANSCSEAPECYVVGNKIRGLPGRPTGIFGSANIKGVAIAANGDIYAANGEMHTIDEYQPSGQFVQAFELDGSEVPRLSDFGEHIESVAIDPVSGHVLVSVTTGQTPEGSFGAIDEFDAATGKYVAQLTQAPGGGHLRRPSELSVDSRGNLYVVEEGEQDSHAGSVDVYDGGHFVPTVTLGPAGGRTAESARLSGAVDPEGFELTECEFEYVSEKQFEEEGFAHPGVAECEPRASGIPADNQLHSVSATVTGLRSGVAYRYLLVAHSAGELGGTGASGTRVFTIPAPPVVESMSASHISSAFVDLGAVIDPSGVPTSYHFEYLTAAAYRENGESFAGTQPATSAPVPDANIGSGGATGSEQESVEVHIGGLTAGSEYRFRAVARSECEALHNPGHQCVTTGATAAFTTLPEPQSGLPDNRAYELVTPAEKEGGSDMFAEEETDSEFFNAHSTGTPAQDGNGFILSTFSPFGAFPSSGESAYVFRRDPASARWTNISLASPSLGVQAIAARGLLFDPVDLSKVAFQDNVGSLLSEEGGYHVELLGPPGAPKPPCVGASGLEGALAAGCYLKLHEDPHYHLGDKEVETFVVGGSHDLNRLVLQSEEKNACTNPDTAAKEVKHGDVLCEWNGGFETLENSEMRPELHLVNELEGKAVSACGAEIGEGANQHNAVSANGTKVFFTAPGRFVTNSTKTKGLEGKEGCWNPVQEEFEHKPPRNAPQLYMHSQGETIKVSAPEAGVSVSSGEEFPARYVGASEDGSKVFFVSKTELTADDAGIHSAELYEYDTETAKLTRVTAGESGHDAGDVQAVYAVAAQGDAVYFTANGVLAANEGPGGSHAAPGGCGPATEGTCNLYRYQAATSTAAARISYVASVNTRDVAHTGSSQSLNPLGEDRRAYSTPDGRFLLFDTREDLTGYSTAGCRAYSEQCMELFRYDAQAAERGEPAVTCVSCATNGAPPVGNAKFDRSGMEGPSEGPAVGMSDNGEYVFFDSPMRLVPQAENHTLAVYEWHNGRIYLLSSPTDPAPSYFLGYSPYYTPSGTKVEGGNVFIGTHARLVPQDTNTVGDIYDARICEPVSPCIGPPVGETAQCEGGACQSPPAPSLVRTPSSMTFSGPGDPQPPGTTSSPSPRHLTKAQKLANAIKACRRDRSKRKRVMCERTAHKKYVPAKNGGHR